jgi:hypothetical protein
MDIMKNLSALFKVKSIVTLAITGVFCYLSVVRVISAELFMTVFTVVISFYFGTQYEKKVSNQQGA